MAETFLSTIADAASDEKPRDEDWCRQALNTLLKQLRSDGESDDLQRVKGMRIVGQDALVDRLVMTLLLNEHILLEGLPGVAKTTAVKFLSADTGLMHLRVQFFPDMQPSDLVGKKRFNIARLQAAAQGSVSEADIENWQDGPLFVNLLVADEINRAPSKVQAALLEAMGERQITPLGHHRHVIRPTREWEMWLRYIRTLERAGRIDGDIWGSFAETVEEAGEHLAPSDLKGVIEALADHRFERLGVDFPFGKKAGWTDPFPAFGASGIDLANPADSQFTAFATQNPIEQQGTYSLSEAQTDRFCFKTIVNYPGYDASREIAKMINPPQRDPDPDRAYTKAPEQELTAEDRQKRDLAMRGSLYFFRRCRELMFGEPGRIGDSRLGKLLDSEVIDQIVRINFYSHLKVPQAGRPADAGRLLLDREQQERMSYLHRSDPDALQLLTETESFQFLNSGATPRGILNLARGALCQSFLSGSDGVTAGDIATVAPDVLRHRIRLNAQARVRGITSVALLDTITEQVLRR